MNTRKKKFSTALAFLLALILTITGCGTAAANTAETSNATQTSGASKSTMFTDRDLSGDYDESSAEKIELSGKSITITKEGTYIISGTLEDGQIIVDADDSAKIQIVLAGASVTSKSSAALYVKNADKVFVTTAEGTENTLANGGSFANLEGDDTNIDGAVFAHDDITFNGSGSLTIKSPAGHGIVGNDDVKLAGGTITIEAANKGVKANDSVRVAEATINITASDDGIHVSDNNDEEEGTASDSFFYIADGTLTIESGDDGIHADAEANIEGGTITVTKSYEGLEALKIEISGGNLDLTASDDGINAAGGNDSSNDNGPNGGDNFGGFGGKSGGGFNDGGSDGSIVISGGSIKVQAGGDGIDANGSVEITGGTTIVEGPTQGDTSVIDFNSTGTITGGTFIGTGGSAMAENFSSVENQGLIAVSVGNQSAGTTVKLTDSNGNTVAEVTPALDYAVVYISTPDMASGNTYTLTAGSYSESIELTENSYSTLSGGFSGGKGGFGGNGGGQPGQGGFGGDNQQGAPSDKNDQNGQSGFGGKHGGPGGQNGQQPSGQPGGNNDNSGGTGNSGNTGNAQVQLPSGNTTEG